MKRIGDQRECVHLFLGHRNARRILEKCLFWVVVVLPLRLKLMGMEGERMRMARALIVAGTVLLTFGWTATSMPMEFAPFSRLAFATVFAVGAGCTVEGLLKWWSVKPHE